MENLYLKIFDSPIGKLIAGADNSALMLLEFYDTGRQNNAIKEICKQNKLKQIEEENPIISQTISELEEYFSGSRKIFSIPIKLTGTAFQKDVWNCLTIIEYGKTFSYRKQANCIGKPLATRAVANANGKNKISIILPCHRVIGSDGALRGYGGGVDKKEFLLELERKNS